MAKRILNRSAVLLFFLCMPVLAAENTYENLPGVTVPDPLKQEQKQEDDAQCTSYIALFDDGGRMKKPHRVYRCVNGNVVTESTRQPLDLRPIPDPYVNGQW